MRVKDFTAEFTVPATATEYAAEVYYLREDRAASAPATRADLAKVLEAQLDVIALPTDAEIEVDILAPDSDPTEAGNWRTDRQSYTATGLNTPLALAYRHGVRIRCKSGGTDGTATVDVAWVGAESE